MGETAALSLSKGMRRRQDLSASGGIPRKQVDEKTSPPQAGEPVSLGTEEKPIVFKEWTPRLMGAVICVRPKGSERIGNEDTVMRL
jgi:hypothetical protein